MGIANDISPKNKKVKRDITKNNAKIGGENFERNINNVPKYSDDPFIFDHDEFQKTDDEAYEEKDNKLESPEKGAEKDSISSAKKGNPMTKWVIILVLVLISLLVYQNYSFISNIFSSNDNIQESDSPNTVYDNDYESKIDDTGSIEKEENSTTESVSNELSDSLNTASAIDRSSLKISVLNGNGITSSAKEVKTILEAAGYIVSNVSNALKFSYINTSIYYNVNKLDEAEDLKSVLTNRTCDLYENSSVAGSYDIVVVVGKN